MWHDTPRRIPLSPFTEERHIMSYAKRPWVGELEAGRYAFCSCGETETPPRCDGSHSRKETGKSPTVAECAETKNYAICMCGTTQKAPFCDGGHKGLG